MYIWEVLGIECTTDVVAIKRAFAQKAKLYHPEEHPEEYKKLRNAYKKAIAQAKQQTAACEKPDNVTKNEPYNVIADSRPESTTKIQKTQETPLSFEDIFKKDRIVEIPPVARPNLNTNRIERPNIEPPRLEAPKLDVPFMEITKEQVNNKRIIQESRQLKLKERKKPEVPSLRELIKQGSGVTPPVIEDPLRLMPEERKKRRVTFEEIPKELDFSFDEVERAYSPEEVEDFFYFFRAIASNPILRDNVECWTLFLEQPDLKDFYRREENCLRMISLIEKYFWGKREILLYFEFFFQVKTGKKMEQFQSWTWKMKKWWGMLPGGNEARCLTPEEADLHNIILEELHKRNLSYDLVHYEAARVAYLEIFISKVRENRGSFKQTWARGHKYRMDQGRKKLVVSFLIPVLVVIAILVFGWFGYNAGVQKTRTEQNKSQTVGQVDE